MEHYRALQNKQRLYRRHQLPRTVSGTIFLLSSSSLLLLPLTLEMKTGKALSWGVMDPEEFIISNLPVTLKIYITEGSFVMQTSDSPVFLKET